jgi:hypothetical protein
MRRAKRIGAVSIIVAAFCLLWILANTPTASAIPAFSRKYQTSCATCHSNYPELNDFGEVFKKNGFKFPMDDDSFVREPPVLLGAKAQKEAFPGAIYPGEIPGTIPISFRYSGNFNYSAKQPDAVDATNFTPRTDLFAPNTFTIIAAGSFGQNISFWIDNDISAGGSGANGGLGDGYLKFDVGHYLHLPSRLLNVRFGQFELDLPFSQARSIYPSSYDIFSQTSLAAAVPAAGVFPSTNNPFFIGTPQRGVELGGYADNYNFTWSVAFDDGTNSAYGGNSSLTARNTKDVYVRVSQKFNLERDPQSRNAVQAAGATGPRDHTSIRLGAFYYHGTNETNLPVNGSRPYPFLGVIQDPFYRVGGDLRFKYRKLELFGVGMMGHDNNHDVDTNLMKIANAPAVTYSGGFAGTNYWIHPWLIAYMRYDFVNSPSDFASGVSQYRTRNRFSPGFQILVRANIKLNGEYQYHWGVPYTDPTTNNLLYYRPSSFVSGIDYAF